mmetsp:Transcript_7867/g.29121  ORF Transcript_7867/g.29121 Transcript_7867/m.29121 type:complete len:270 (+) Transcript_7867:165-974(+)
MRSTDDLDTERRRRGYVVPLWRRWLASVVIRGGIPRHVAVIMDGNRRYAETKGMDRTEGHRYGYSRLLDVLAWLLELEVEQVSVYAFSIDNFRRSATEVAVLMDLLKEKMAEMLEQGSAAAELLTRYQVRVRIVGDLTQLPDTVRALSEELMARTRTHEKHTLHVMLAYTAKEEMVHAISAYASRPRQGELPDAHIDDGDTVQTSSNRNLGRYRMQEEDHAEKIQELEKCLRTGAGVPPAELLIRTSGETRLSNFMLWQSSRALLLFLR